MAHIPGVVQLDQAVTSLEKLLFFFCCESYIKDFWLFWTCVHLQPWSAKGMCKAYGAPAYILYTLVKQTPHVQNTLTPHEYRASAVQDYIKYIIRCRI